MKSFSQPKPPEPGGNFIRLDQLINRLLLIRPHTVEMVTSKQTDKEGNPRPDYKKIVADVVILDGRPKIGEDKVSIPHVVLNMWISGAQIVPQIEEHIDNDDEPYALGRLVLGEPNSFGQSARVLDPFDDDDAELASEYLDSLANAVDV